MNMRVMLRTVSVVCAFVLGAAGAAPLRYVDDSAVDVARLLPPPPSAESAETRAELELLLRVQETRTPSQVERARADNKIELASFTPALGPWATAANLPLTDRLLEEAITDAKHFSDRAKDLFNRPRPHVTEKRIKVAIEGQEGSCYPSGHATRGMLLALILAELAPDKKAALLERGRELGWARAVAGVHFPSDLTAGRVLGQAVAQALLANPAFQQDLARARAEVEAARQGHEKPGRPR